MVSTRTGKFAIRLWSRVTLQFPHRGCSLTIGYLKPSEKDSNKTSEQSKPARSALSSTRMNIPLKAFRSSCRRTSTMANSMTPLLLGFQRVGERYLNPILLAHVGCGNLLEWSNLKSKDC